MKTFEVPVQATEINHLLEQAGNEDLLVQTADGRQFMLVAVDEFDLEIARTRQNEKLMALLDARAKGTASLSLDEVKRQLGL